MNQYGRRLLAWGLAAFLITMASAAAQEPQTQLQAPAQPLPLSNSPTAFVSGMPQPLTLAQQRARYEADQRMLRTEYYKWIGYDSLRPSMPNVLYTNELNHYYFQPIRYRPVWAVNNYGSHYW